MTINFEHRIVLEFYHCDVDIFLEELKSAGFENYNKILDGAFDDAEDWIEQHYEYYTQIEVIFYNQEELLLFKLLFGEYKVIYESARVENNAFKNAFKIIKYDGEDML